MSGVAWVTGASQGLGAAVALHLAENGWTVAASARSADGLKALADDPRAGGRIHAIPCDVTDGAANAAAVAQIESELGPIALAILN
ncbi:MAG: SDR family oxidoreductase, partial [Pseudomonadota bacterium]